jgi:hypothetical protein
VVLATILTQLFGERSQSRHGFTLTRRTQAHDVALILATVLSLALLALAACWLGLL